MRFPEKEKELFNKIMKQLTKNAKKNYKENNPTNTFKDIIMKNKFSIIISAVIFLLLAQSCQETTTVTEQTLFEKKAAIDPPVTYSGKYLTGIDFPIGAVGGSVIRMNGKAERQWWQIFNNFEERAGSGIVPNSFFALRTKTKNKTVVRALQTSSVGAFSAMDSLNFQGEFPLGWYHFGDNELPIKVGLEAYSFLIPMDLKSS